MTEDEKGTPIGTVEEPVTNELEIPPRHLALVRDVAPPALVRAWRRLVSWLKRKHWIFRLGDFLKLRLEMQDGQRRDMETLAKQHQQLVVHVKHANDAFHRLDALMTHHERGPLKASRAEWDRRAGDGVVNPVAAKREAPKRKAAKVLDAMGKAVDIAPEKEPA